jgi:hypothetical protein
VHPLAGQGVNLGFGDALALVNTLHRGVEGGFDIGEVSSRVLIVFVCLRIMGLKKIPYLPIFSVSKSPGLCPWALFLSRKEY